MKNTSAFFGALLALSFALPACKKDAADPTPTSPVPVAAPIVTGLSPTSGLVGDTVTISGTNLTGTAVVSFNGTAAPGFTINSATSVTATVPAGATTGPLTLTTPGGTSNGLTFTVVVPLPPTKTELIANKNWLLTAVTADPGIDLGGGMVVTDLYALSSACDQDNLYRFEAPNVYKQDEGATRCSVSSPQTTTGTWMFNATETAFTTTLPSFPPMTYELLELTETTLKCSAVEQLFGTTITYTYTKQ